MVPVKLGLKNFMSYKEATLNLDGVHLACLSGDNGAGKSALLDAMTWSLWGKGRASDDELITQGQIEMQTDFEFQVNQQMYRVVRTRTRKGAGHTELSFQIGTPEGTWRNIGGNTKRLTQDEIIKTVRMEYETFINSAFLLQGRADEFTTHTAGERKKVLAEILGLGYYDELETQAREANKEAQARQKYLDNQLNDITTALSYRPQYERQKQEATSSLQTSRNLLKETETALTGLQQQVDQLKLKDEQRLSALKKLNEVRQETLAVSGDLNRAETDIKNCQTIIERSDQIEQGYRDWQDADRQHEAFMEKFHRYEGLITQRRKLEDILKQTEINLTADQRSAQKNLTELQEQTRNLPGLEKDYAGLEKQLAETVELIEQLDQKKIELQKGQTELAGLRGETTQLEKSLKEIEKRAKSVPQAGERCDRCGTVLDETAHNHTVEEYRKEYRESQNAIKERKSRIEVLQSEVSKLEEGVRQLEIPVRKAGGLQTQAGKLEEKLKQGRQAADKATRLETEIASLTRQLERKEYCQTERQQLESVQLQIRELGYDSQAHQQIRERLVGLKKYEQEKNRLDEARRNIVNLEGQAERYQKNLTRLAAEEAQNQTLAETLTLEVEALPQLSYQLRQAQSNKEEAKRGVELYERQVWEAESKLKQCDELEVDKKRKEVEHNEAAQQASIYKELSEAFGKKGLQALIIETALPELEDETNRLLGNMSDGRMNVRFETQRDSKKGDAIETLDLKISDENGVRAYELFSGGEAFRVNFAVRVALSKLLARRSGAALRTLIIDEGFGSQDGAGRERLIEAIRNIENDFDRVLVITHIQELKDVFPVRIDIVKTANGSQISIN